MAAPAAAAAPVAAPADCAAAKADLLAQARARTLTLNVVNNQHGSGRRQTVSNQNTDNYWAKYRWASAPGFELHVHYRLNMRLGVATTRTMTLAKVFRTTFGAEVSHLSAADWTTVRNFVTMP